MVRDELIGSIPTSGEHRLTKKCFSIRGSGARELGPGRSCPGDYHPLKTRRFAWANPTVLPAHPAFLYRKENDQDDGHLRLEFQDDCSGLESPARDDELGGVSMMSRTPLPQFEFPLTTPDHL